jgi:hypothetical protein
MRGRAKGNQQRIIIQAHQSEMMAREKRLKPLKSYLKQSPAKPAARDDEVLAMLRSIGRKHGGVKIKRLNPKE